MRLEQKPLAFHITDGNGIINDITNFIVESSIAHQFKHRFTKNFKNVINLRFNNVLKKFQASFLGKKSRLRDVIIVDLYFRQSEFLSGFIVLLPRNLDDTLT